VGDTPLLGPRGGGVVGCGLDSHCFRVGLCTNVTQLGPLLLLKPDLHRTYRFHLRPGVRCTARGLVVVYGWVL
jgi:hypothetical protein